MIVGIVVGATAFFYRVEVFAFLLAPANGKLSPFDGLPVFFEPLGALSATFGISTRAFLVGFFPTALYGVYRMLAPVLPAKHKRVYRIFTPLSIAFFVGGAAFAYYVVMGRMVAFLLQFSEDVAVPLIALDAYLGLLFRMVFSLGLIFQIPLIMFLLTKTGAVGYQRFRRSRRVVIAFASILAALITPTFDLFSWSLMAVPIYVVYEFGLLLSWLARPEEGNYMYLKSIGFAVVWVLRRPAVACTNTRMTLRRHGLG